ncbi:hypothetical protein N0V86_005491 [Didymella sp. IMI 355093]|nr:hypothetical protein N0V86_005491 [Didymella sp. IMI 355093]
MLRIAEEGPLFGNFKLVLQSVVCHRGVSVDSGHYISLIRANEPARPNTSHSEEDDDTGTWLRFDDLSNPRVTEVDIKKALRDESPYLLFYQVQPIDDELASRGDPPTYAEAQDGAIPSVPSGETLSSSPEAGVTDVESGGEWDKMKPADMHPGSVISDEPASRASMSSNRRSSLAFEDIEGLSRGRTEPHTPSDESKAGFLSASRRGSRTWLGTKSRPTSQSGEGRLSLTLSRLTGRGSKDKLTIAEGGAVEDPVIVIDSVESQDQTAPEATSPVKEQKDPILSRKKSKKGKKDHHRSKSRGPTGELSEKKNKDRNRPDRECSVM